MKRFLFVITAICLLSARPVADDLILFLRQKLQAYSQSHPFVGVSATFNQTKYALGDTAFFSIRTFDENFASLKGKKIFALALIDSHGKLSQRLKFATIDGKGFNQLAIPLEAEPGLYHCVFYAEASGTVFYTKELIVVEKNRIKIVNDSLSDTVSFFPEGGRLVSGVKNNVVVRSPFDGIHIIRNDNNQEVTRVEVKKNRLSRFILTPVAGEHYHCEIEGRSGRHDMPLQISSEGIALSVFSSEQAAAITLQVPANSSLRKAPAYVTVVNNQKLIFSQQADFTDSTTLKIIIPQENLGQGLHQVTIFTEAKDILAERVFYARGAIVEPTLKAIDPHKQRESVTEELALQDKNGNPITGNFAVTVFHKKFFEDVKEAPFQDEFYLEQVPNIMQYLNAEHQPSIDRLTLIDDYLIAKNYKLFSWNEVLNQQEGTHEQFGNSLKLKGKALLKESEVQVPDSTMLMGYLQNSMMGYETTVIKGNVDLNFRYDFFGEDELFYSLEKRSEYLNDSYLAIAEDPLPDFQPKRSAFVQDNLIDEYADHQFKKKRMDRSYTFFAVDDKEKIKYVDPNSKYETKAGSVDVKINVRDYVVFITVEDLVREVIPFLMVRTSKNKKMVRLLLNYQDHNVKPKGEPLFIIDGVLSKNSEFFLEMSPADILTIKLINNPNKLTKWGALGKNGIVFVATKQSAINAKRVPTNSVKVIGFNKAVKFPMHDYAITNDKRIPDFRTALYWNPQVKVDTNGRANFSFYTSDMPGEYIVQIKGLTDKGQPFEATTTFVVGR